ncbi:histone deacetylase family protein [Caenispirillum salinarum]|uniref:histone deacetylase family protein n=1 Tax=Caenispirillum salinarum TaxID=859058 RepID=UPI00384EE3C7
MLTVYSEDCRLHHGRAELNEGQLVPCFENPSRTDIVLDRLKAVDLGEIVAPRDFGVEPLKRVHDAGFVDFLAECWDLWTAQGRDWDAIPFTFGKRGMRDDRIPKDIDGRIAYYAMDAGTPLTAGTWKAATASANCALSAAEQVAGGLKSAFAACRPPGHHASIDYYGGYCFLNNAAIAAQALRDNGAARVSVLDVDYHHGNGTQSIFYDRADVQFLSLHADPEVEYPYFLGHADETGTGAGEGFNHNFPLPWGTDWERWSGALEEACRRIQGYRPDVLVVSLGLDTFEQDPISKFTLSSDRYPLVGARLAALKVPTVFVLEGGYAVDDLGVNAVNVLTGFEDA